jgi:UDP-4-amino-4,6-dideoxy-L-N-acetyl-beta-L-altrosamine transaminase
VTTPSTIPYGCQFIDDADIKAVEETLRSTFLTQGPKVAEFEEKLAETCGSKYAVAFSSGTSALHGAYSVAGLGKGDSFVTTPNTFLATSNAGLYLGARPEFSEIQADTGNLDPVQISEEHLNKASLLVPVHYAGHAVDLKTFEKIARKYDLKLIEDGCHAIGGAYEGSKIGSCHYSQMTTFSFHPVKHITTGEGGAVTTNDGALYEELKEFRSHGVYRNPERQDQEGPWHYEMRSLGFNYRMSDIQAALGIVQLAKLGQFIDKRREIASAYHEAFAGHPDFEIPPERDGVTHAYHLYPIRMRDSACRRRVYEELKKKGVLTQVHYIPVHTQPYYRARFTSGLSLPIAEDFYSRELSLPIFPKMKTEELKTVIQAVLEVFDSLD